MINSCIVNKAYIVSLIIRLPIILILWVKYLTYIRLVVIVRKYIFGT